MKDAAKVFVVKLPTKPDLRPNAEAARRLVEKLREVRASQQIIEVAEKAAQAAEAQPQD